MLEEAYEAVDAIDANDVAGLREELGDVLLQVVLQSQIAQDAGEFTIDDVCRDVNEKIIRRHPHVFAATVIGEVPSPGIAPLQIDDGTSAAALDEWDRIKRDERKEKTVRAGSEDAEPEGFLDSTPTGMPALIQAQKISRKVIGIGFEWETIDDIWGHVFSEIEELRHAYEEAPKDTKGRVAGNLDVELEVGDVLFTFANIALRMGIDAEYALRASCSKFRARWKYIEKAARAQGRNVEELSTEEMNVLWDEAKLTE